MKKLIGVLILISFAASCRPPAPRPEVYRKPKVDPLNPIDPVIDPVNGGAITQEWYVSGTEKDFASEVKREGAVSTQDLKLEKSSYWVRKEILPATTPKTYTFVVSAYTPKLYKINYVVGTVDGTCSNNLTFKLFCAKFTTGMPAGYPTPFGVSRSSVKVYVVKDAIGTRAEISDFTVNSTTNEVTLGATVATSGTQLFIDFVPAVNSMKFARNINPSTLLWQVEGNNTQVTYDPTTGVIVFPATVAPFMAPVKFGWQYELRNPKLYYGPFKGASQVTLTDAAKVPVPFTLKDETLHIEEKDFTEGKVLLMTYTSGTAGKFEIPLDKAPIDKSWVITTNVATCKEGAGITVSPKAISVECAAPAGTELVVKYAYKYAQMENTFSLSEVMDPSSGEWTVTVDGMPTKFERMGNVVTITAPLAPGMKVTVSFKRAV